ncbi:MAG: NAD+ synthase [Candidatus Omnitrophota bacterium]
MRENSFRIALGQINATVGDLEGNSQKMSEYLSRAAQKNVDIICFPELSLTGYPPEDLLLKPKFIADNLCALRAFARSVDPGIITIAGFVDRKGNALYNAAAVIYKKKVRHIYHKMLLPNYGVFDEKRYFSSGDTPDLYAITRREARTSGKLPLPFVFGVNICEDIWHAEGPLKAQNLAGAQLILNINASPYHAGKIKEREGIICAQARKNRVYIAYTNLVGGQDELVFDGQSMVVDRQGAVIARAAAFEEELLIADVALSRVKAYAKKKAVVLTLPALSSRDPERAQIPLSLASPLEPAAEVYKALTLGLRDYVVKNGFQKTVIGLSGGVDSALVAALAVDALGRSNVTGVFMPTRYSSNESETDARQLADNLGIAFMSISIEQIYKMYLLIFEPYFAGLEKNVTEENLQARIRGTCLMALSNKFSWLVLTTGNKSEMSTGYATLYGDMAGGFAVIKDVPKGLVYQLSYYRNSISFVIPQRILTKEPTAELRPNQLDRDTLAPYEQLDPVLKAYVEENKDINAIVALGFDSAMVSKVLQMVDKSEYKRRQSPPGIKITPKAFGRDRRMPITNRYRG